MIRLEWPESRGELFLVVAELEAWKISLFERSTCEAKWYPAKFSSTRMIRGLIHLLATSSRATVKTLLRRVQLRAADRRQDNRKASDSKHEIVPAARTASGDLFACSGSREKELRLTLIAK